MGEGARIRTGGAVRSRNVVSRRELKGKGVGETRGSSNESAGLNVGVGGRSNVRWHPVAFSVAVLLLDHFRITKRKYPEEPWRDSPHSAGSVSSLPAYPLDLGKERRPSLW